MGPVTLSSTVLRRLAAAVDSGESTSETFRFLPAGGRLGPGRERDVSTSVPREDSVVSVSCRCSGRGAGLLEVVGFGSNGG
jgi:hypothetical protein